VVPLWVRLDFSGVGLARRDDANHAAVTSVAVTNQQQSQRTADAKQNKALLIFRVIRVVNQLGALINENGSGFVKADTVLLEIGGSFAVVLLETKCAHFASLTTL
jgi:hypothetical protein